jgi:hypothetical protein
VLLPRAHNFVGRDEELAQLTEALETGRKAVIAGLRGVGYVMSYRNMIRVANFSNSKSQIALEYCYQYRKKNTQITAWARLGPTVYSKASS